MNYNLDRYFKKRLSVKDKEELLHKITFDLRFRKELLSRCLLVKGMINIDKEKSAIIFSSILTKDKKK